METPSSFVWGTAVNVADVRTRFVRFLQHFEAEARCYPRFRCFGLLSCFLETPAAL